jgi:hypothetical protein
MRQRSAQVRQSETLRDRVLDRFGAPLVGNVQHVHLGGDPEFLPIQMSAAADAGRAVGKRARLCFRGGDQVPHRRDARGGRNDEQHRLRAERRDLDQVLARVVGQVGIQRRVDRVARGVDEQQVAVGRRPRHGDRGDRAAGARAVLDHHRLAPELGELAADGAGDDVGHAPGREGDHHAHRLRRKRLRGRARGEREQGGREARLQRRGCAHQRCSCSATGSGL